MQAPPWIALRRLVRCIVFRAVARDAADLVLAHQHVLLLLDDRAQRQVFAHRIVKLELTGLQVVTSEAVLLAMVLDLVYGRLAAVDLKQHLVEPGVARRHLKQHLALEGDVAVLVVALAGDAPLESVVSPSLDVLVPGLAGPLAHRRP